MRPTVQVSQSGSSSLGRIVLGILKDLGYVPQVDVLGDVIGEEVGEDVSLALGQPTP